MVAHLARVIAQLGEPLLVVPSTTATRGTPDRRTSRRRRRSCAPGSLTTRSGRRRLSSVATCACVSKSQCSSIPAISTTRRSWISPQRPRTFGRSRSALTRFPVSLRSWLLRLCELAHLDAQARSTRGCARPRAAGASRRPSGATPAIGVTRCSTACLRCSSSWVWRSWSCSSCDLASSRKDWLFVASASAASAFSVEPSDAACLLERAHAARVLGPHHEPGCRDTDEETDDESDDHWGRRTLEIESDGTGTDHENAGPDEPESPSEPARRAYVAQGRRGQAEKARSLRTFAPSALVVRDGRVQRLHERLPGCSEEPLATCSVPLVGPTRIVGVPVTFFCFASLSTAFAVACASELLTSSLPLRQVEAVDARRDRWPCPGRSGSRCSPSSPADCRRGPSRTRSPCSARRRR